VHENALLYPSGVVKEGQGGPRWAAGKDKKTTIVKYNKAKKEEHVLRLLKCTASRRRPLTQSKKLSKQMKKK